MPYDNEYNRSIAQKIRAIDRRYADKHEYSQVVPDGYKSLVQTANASTRDGEDGVYGDENPSLVGGSGFAQGTFRDTGYSGVLGAKGSGVKYKKGEMNGAGFWDDFKKGFNMVFEPAAKVIKAVAAPVAPELSVGLTALGYGKKGKKKSDAKMKGGIVMGDQVGMPWDMFKEHAMGGLDLPIFRKNVKEGAYKLSGKGYDDFKKKIGKMSVADIKKFVGLGKRKACGMGMSGGAVLGNPDPLSSSNESVERKVGGRTTMLNLVPKQEMHSSSMSGQGKKSSSLKSRAEVVKKVMKERGVSMIEASKIVKAENLWKK